MGNRGGRKGGRGRGGGGGGGGGRARADNRTDKALVVRQNERFEKYYNELKIVPEEEKEQFWEALRRDLPNSFRFTGSKGHALAVQERLRNYYIPEIQAIQYEGNFVDVPQPVPWFPDQLAWFMTTPKSVVRRFKPFASFQKFLVAETDVGNITRQEVVSMIPPLVIDIKPGMTVLDLCAAPGSKSAQLLEMIHGGEEERCREVAEGVGKGLERPTGEDFLDDGRSTGLLIANDVDYKRAHMLVHQMKRLASPNLIVTNHDATIFPSIKISSPPAADGKPVQNRYLKFDRILADVPCSGDGTPRKNLEIWKQWTPSNGLGLHAIQVRILIRALQMLKSGGRVVYSTCSMNPVEDEAVLASAIRQCGGTKQVELLETKDLLPGLQRSPGMRNWSIMDKAGRIWNSWHDVEKQRADNGEEGLGRIQAEMFPPEEDLHLERAMRVYPHTQDTGAFFIAILEKKSEMKVQSQPKSIKPEPVKVKAVDTNSSSIEIKAEPNGQITEVQTKEEGDMEDDAEATEDSLKRKRESVDGTEEDAADGKRTKVAISETSIKAESDEKPTTPIPQQQNDKSQMKRNKNQTFEEPFKYLDENIPELQDVQNFYQISSLFPRDRYMVRNAEGTATKNIYYTTALAKDILQQNEGKGMKFVHSGVKMFVKQDAPSKEVCPWRIQTDGLRILETWVGRHRVLTLKKKPTLEKLLTEMFPRFSDDNWTGMEELKERLEDISMGCCVLIAEPTDEEGGFSERMVFPLWKSLHSVNLMLPKEDRRALLLRLYNSDAPLVNMGQQKKSQDAKQNGSAGQEKDQATDPVDLDEPEDGGVAVPRANTSSPEPEAAG